MNTEPVSVIDDVSAVQTVDTRNMLRLINELPEQFETALGIARYLAVEEREQQPSMIYLTGSGSSANAVDLAAAVLNEETDLPIVVSHAPRVPKCVGEGSLAIVVDYAGKSEISLRNYREARSRGAEMVCVTSGGALLEEAVADGSLTVRVPPGQPPRTAPGYQMVPPLILAERMGLTQSLSERLAHAIKGMKNAREWLRVEYPSARNIAKRAAETMAGKLVVIYGAADYRDAVARRWRSQINANSKALAVTDVFQDVAETGISGWTTAERQCGGLAVVLLGDPGDKGEIADTVKACRRRLEGYNPIDIDMQGATTLEKMLYGVYVGDYVSYYLALLHGVDPTLVADLSEPEPEPAPDSDTDATDELLSSE